MPTLKPNSTESEIVEVFLALTSFAMDTHPLWREDKDHFASMDPKLLSEFAETIDPCNGMSSLHLAVT
jgi:hypothetical protein